ncbi:membrane-anchored junction protein isoform X3 [Hippoglossus stenolepis]|uniref:membrane-anchored junction protein isoform X3 n=1 Tax=Hippoglossus stenolepis TaxID=195615 RepID=UPI00159C32D6|nr:membrane-anchored junction protein isoform X3 [Hippoglossus stenolepis]
MTLETFSFPLPETRFFRADGFVYKFKIRGGSSFSGEEVMEGNCFNQELEDIIRTVLGNLDNLQPFSSTHFNVFPYKKRWEGLSKVMCKHDEKNLSAYPFILILYLEKNTQNGKHAEKRLSPGKEREHHFSVSKPQSKRTKTDSPLEEAILQDLVKELEAESKISMVGRLHVDNPHEEGEVKEDPGHVVKLKSDINMMSESPGEVQPGTIQDKEVEEDDKAASERSGFLTRLASRIFPFSLFFRDD